MATTQSGYPVVNDYGDPQLISNPVVPGTGGKVKIAGGLRKGDVATVLLYFAARFHQEVENLGIDATTDDWGYGKREIRGGTGWSNHAGGCAIDLNSTRHPQHKRGTFSTSQYARMRQISYDLTNAAGAQVLRLGIDWSDNSVDEMHAEIKPGGANDGSCARAAAAIRAGRVPNVPAELRTGGAATPVTSNAWPLKITQWYGAGGVLTGDGLRHAQVRLNAVLGAGLMTDGQYGPKTKAAIAEYQRRFLPIRVRRRGLLGRVTWTRLFKKGK